MRASRWRLRCEVPCEFPEPLLASVRFMTPASERPVSIAMATYNGMAYVAEQVESILAQITGLDQLVIVDDCSTDGTWEYLSALRHPSIELVRQPRNRGVRLSFEEALRRCRNDFILLSDQDDIWLPGKRRAMLERFESDRDVTVVVSDAQLIDGEGRVIAPSFMATRGGFSGGVLSTLVKNRYLGCAMAFRRDVLAKALPIPALAPMHDMWIGAVARSMGLVAFIDTPLIAYRRHGGNASPLSHASAIRMIGWRLQFAAALLLRSFRR
jgi:glycosyltransferase involved in cell wall biosynthesis